MPERRAGRWLRRLWRTASAVLGGAILIAAVAGGMLYWQFAGDGAESFYDDPVKQFKYGSTGGEMLAGLPLGIFKALPRLCPDHLQGDSWEALGFVYEPGMDRPIGTSVRRSLGFDRVALNCATCHAGTWRAEPKAEPVVVIGMPAHRVDLGRFTQFIEDCVSDERFNPWQVVQAAEATGERYSWLQRGLLKYAVVPAMREAVLLIRYRFRFLNNEPRPGPGRFDTFNPERALLNWPFELLPPRETIGIVDFPSLWLQGPRAARDMHLHWDGNNDFVGERNRSAAFGTGAVPTTLDRESMGFIENWLKSDANVPPKYPFPIDAARAATGQTLYQRYCAACHGISGRDFTGALVGQVTPIGEIRTDPCRLDNYTHALAAEQGNLYAAYPDERFTHFRKTNGYANLPLDGIWLRGPYLHNGSVPTVRDLLDRAEERPRAFWRGNDVIDQRKLGFVSDVPDENGARLFRYETHGAAGDAVGTVCKPGPWAGNSNSGHDGAAYGTELSPEQKDAIVEYLKTF
jgi:hypothetical protein